MEQQRVLRKRSMEDMIRGVKTGALINLFKNNEFQIDEKNTLIMPHIERPISLLSKMNLEDDFESAIKLYEAYNNLTPLEAADPRFWNYLAVVDLYPYLKARWPNVYNRKEGTNEISYILEHFLFEDNQSGMLLRSGLAGLWWSVYLSIDELNIDDKYHLTRVLFWNQTLRTRTMGTSFFAKKRDLALGFLDYCLMKGQVNFGNFEKEHQELTKYINHLGGSKPIAVFNREEIKEILIKKFPLSNTPVK